MHIKRINRPEKGLVDRVGEEVLEGVDSVSSECFEVNPWTKASA